MKNQFCNYEISLALKELGFDEPCFAFYDGEKELNYFKIYNGNKKLITNKAILTAENKFINMPKKALAPLWQQIIDWLRGKHNLHVLINPIFACYNIDILEYDPIADVNICIDLDGLNFEDFTSYQEAREQTVLKAIEIIKSSQNESI